MAGDKPNSYQGSARNDFRFLPPQGIGSPGSVVVGGGGGIPEPFFRNVADERRSMYRRVPSAEYPDGYLGTIETRRGDRLLNAVKGRVNERNYQRGVHKGERIDPSDYYWPPEFTPEKGLATQARGMHQAPIGSYQVEPSMELLLPANGERLLQELGPHRQEQMRRLAPTWKF
jgi:hypothetical protein